MINLKTRLEKLEARHLPSLLMEFVRIIQHGDLTQGQERQIAKARAKGRGIIHRIIVSAT
jgi:hypothetical protein